LPCRQLSQDRYLPFALANSGSNRVVVIVIRAFSPCSVVWQGSWLTCVVLNATEIQAKARTFPVCWFGFGLDDGDASKQVLYCQH
jgi:hypothetical protein